MSNDYKSDPFDPYMWTIILVVVGVFVLFFYFVPPVLVVPWATFRFIESFLLGWVSDTHMALRTYLMNTRWWQISYSTAFSIERGLVFHSTWIYLTFFLKPCYLIITKKTLRDKLSTRLNLEEIIEQETKVWRYNRWLTKFNPSNESDSVRKGRFAIRESMYSGLKRTKVLNIDRMQNKVVYDENLLRKICINQLRYPNHGIEKFSKLQKQIYCIFALRESTLPSINTAKIAASARRKQSLCKLIAFIPNIPLKLYTTWTIQDFLPKTWRNVWTIWDRQQITDNEDLRIEYLGDLSCNLIGEIDDSILDYLTNRIVEESIKNERIQKLCEQHAYVETFLRRMLYEARSYGKLPPNHFSWLKIKDRGLWYALNDEMLPSMSFEAIGVKSHFEIELESGMSEPFPQVEQGMLLVEAIVNKLSVAEYDRIDVVMEHPYAEKFGYDPNVVYEEHLARLESDPEYRLTIFKIENGVA
ncbi:hypothetical protein ACNO5E_08775 [Vibrio parahaemolyticus]|uniref:secretion/conjugation apparatus DotM-related subunit n=1 Tax=Vibrio parahaemolyticus TaxID=670 RepID=UPI0008130EB1|nr:hypothetical protein [Vibrio parahaemolyticus]OCP68283.1 hypothetical protein AKH08_15815 [Vibrio parahaemolyticus]